MSKNTPTQELTPLVLGTHTIQFRTSDGYGNLTALCQAAGKLPADFVRQDGIQQYLQALSASMGFPIDELVISKPGPMVNGGGKWAHPLIMQRCAQWCNPTYAVAVDQHLEDWRTGKVVAVDTKQMRRMAEFTARADASLVRAPKRHWTIFGANIDFFQKLSCAGLDFSDKAIIDISMGMCWAKHWQAQALNEKYGPRLSASINYPGHYPQAAANPHEVWAYPNKALPEYLDWREDVYCERQLPNYLASKDVPKIPQVIQLLLN